jgi:hypothetical protein
MGYHLEPSLTVANVGSHTLGHLKITPIWGVSRPPLAFSYFVPPCFVFSPGASAMNSKWLKGPTY